MKSWSCVARFAPLAAVLCGCGTTGGATVEFDAYALGSHDAQNGELSFHNERGYDVVLTRAKLHVAALYLNASVPSSGSQATSCTLPGIYVAEVLAGLDIDTLSPAPQPFPVLGDGIALGARVAEVWLAGGAIDTIDDFTVILTAEGTATRAGESYPFQARLTIGRNRLVASTDPAFPSAHPICKQRIVSPIAVDFTPEPGGALYFEVDPRAFFATVEFAALHPISQSPPLFEFDDAPSGPAELALYNGLHDVGRAYSFTWR